jgi:archaellum component FlaC
MQFMAEQPNNLVLELLRGLRTEVGGVKSDIQSVRNELKSVKDELKGDINSLRADVASDLLKMQKETREQIGGVRRALTEYHSSVVGHGIQISELQDRVRRIEQHLRLPPLGAY